MKHYLNVCDVNGAAVAPVDIITFGSPCQDLSVAGKRAGLDGERSGLFREAIRIIKEMRLDTYELFPRFAIWENVPGAFSSNGGADFAAVLNAFITIAEPQAPAVSMPPKGWPTAGGYRDMGGRWSIAWRVLDAQYHGVPQRRRRILLVSDFAGNRAGEILFKCQGLPGYPPQSGETGQGITPDAQGGTGAAEHGGLAPICMATQQGGAEIRTDDKAPCLTAMAGMSGNNQPVVSYALQGSMIGRADKNGPQGDGVNEDVSFTLNTIGRHAVAYGFCHRMGAKAHGIGFEAEKAPTLRSETPDTAVCYGIGAFESNAWKSDNPHSGVYEAEVAKTLDLNGGNPGCNQGGMAVVFGKGTRPHSADEPQVWKEADKASTLNVFDSGEARAAELVCAPAVFENHSQDTRYKDPLDVAPIVSAQFGTGGNNQPFVVNKAHGFTMQGFGDYTDDGIASSLKRRDFKDATDLIAEEYAVRRLTPTECARLQGFPDWWGELPTIKGMDDELYRFWCADLLEKAKVEGTARWDDLMGCYVVWRRVEDIDGMVWIDTGNPYKDKTQKQMVAWFNKLHTDAAEYKMWGNGVALPVVRVPLHGMAALGATTMGSLFDGSGGFPLAGVLEGITPLWSSEIEPYPIAVTLARFGNAGEIEERGAESA